MPVRAKNPIDAGSPACSPQAPGPRLERARRPSRAARPSATSLRVRPPCRRAGPPSSGRPRGARARAVVDQCAPVLWSWLLQCSRAGRARAPDDPHGRLPHPPFVHRAAHGDDADRAIGPVPPARPARSRDARAPEMRPWVRRMGRAAGASWPRAAGAAARVPPRASPPSRCAPAVSATGPTSSRPPAPSRRCCSSCGRWSTSSR